MRNNPTAAFAGTEDWNKGWTPEMGRARARARREAFLKPPEVEAIIEQVETKKPEPVKPVKCATMIRIDADGVATHWQEMIEVVANGIEGEVNERVMMDEIIHSVSTVTGIKKNELKSARRHKNIVISRQICMFLAKAHTSLSLPQIGRLLGGRDHSTIIHGVRKTKSRLADESGATRQIVLKVEAQLQIHPQFRSVR